MNVRSRLRELINRVCRSVCSFRSDAAATGTIWSIVYIRVLAISKTRVDKRANLLYDFEAISVIAMKDIRAHECENGHDVDQNRCWTETRKSCYKHQCLLECLWVIRGWIQFSKATP